MKSDIWTERALLVWAVRCVIKCMLEHMFVPLNTKLEYKMLVLLNSQIYY